MRQRRTPQEMFPLIESWETSGMTQESFCEFHGLSMGLFAYWRKKYQQRGAAGRDQSSANECKGFVPIAVSQSRGVPVLELSVGNAQLRFHELPSVDWLHELLVR